MIKLEKSISFLNIMVRVVFVSTFIFTAFVGYMAWCKEWEMLATTLTERWFTVMVGELIVMGLIQITKDIVNSRLRVEEMKAYSEEEQNG